MLNVYSISVCSVWVNSSGMETGNGLTLLVIYRLSRCCIEVNAHLLIAETAVQIALSQTLWQWNALSLTSCFLFVDLPVSGSATLFTAISGPEVFYLRYTWSNLRRAPLRWSFFCGVDLRPIASWLTGSRPPPWLAGWLYCPFVLAAPRR